MLAVISGATSGIGAEFARQLSSTHTSIWLIGRREKKIRELAEDLRSRYETEVRVLIMDLSDQTVIQQLAELLEKQTDLDILVNNAGYAEDGQFKAVDWQKHRDIMNVHVEATLRLTYAALGVMLNNGRGSIINVSSVASFVSTPGSSLYGPTKAFIRSFSETLAVEYKDRNIKIQALCPGFTITDFHKKLGLRPETFYKKHGILRSWSAAMVVNKSLQDMQRGTVISVPGWNYKLLVILLRRLPISLLLWMAGKGNKSHRYSD